MTKDQVVQSDETAIDTATIRRLNSLAVTGLQPMFDPEHNLFCVRLKRTDQELIRDGLSRRYTLMTLAGLRRGEDFGLRNPFDSDSIFDGLLKNANLLDNLGDLGLLLWVCALMAPERYDEIYPALEVGTALGRYREGRETRTMELAWFLAGLAHGVLAGYPSIPGLSDLAHTSFDLLKKNQGRKGIFGHLGSGGGLAYAARGRMGSFADQVYPIYALAKYGMAFDNDDALRMARACAETICELQGPLGQWWWHYDAKTGRLARRYPVYSVHQDAMAPMALFALGESTSRDYRPWIFRGLPWIYGKNELNLDLCDTSTSIVWRSIYPPRFVSLVEETLSLFGIGPQTTTPTRLSVKFESRPYHLGWILYAFAQYGFA